MMKKPKSPAAQAVTAHAADTGRAVFLTPSGEWHPSVAEAAVVTTAGEADALLAAALRDADENIVVEPYLIEMTQEDGRWRPVRLRELIRSIGPTIEEISSPTMPAA